MPRIRSTKPEFWGDRKLARLLSRDARLLYMGLWNLADEHARLQGDARFIKGQVFPYDDDLDEPAVDGLLEEICAARRAVRYEVEGDPYLFLPKLAKHQRLEPHKVASKYPDPPETAGQEPVPSPAQIFSDEPAPGDDETGKKDASLCSREHVAGSMGQVVRGADALAPDDPTATLLAEHAAGYAQPLPPSALAKIKVEIMRLVAEGVSPARIRVGLERIRAKNLAVSLLPQLVTDATPTTRPSDADTKVAATLALAERFAAADTPTRKGLTA